MATQKYCVKMRFNDKQDQRPAGSHCYLSHNGRHEWCLKTAKKHLKDVMNNPSFQTHYDHFELEEA